MVLIIAQIVGGAAVALYLLSFQLKQRRHIVLTTCVSNVLYVVQYCLLGASSGAVLDIIAAVSSFFAGKKNAPRFRKYAKLAAVLTVLLIVSVGTVLAVIQQKGIVVFSIIGALFQTGGLWFQNEQTIRKMALCGAPFWLIYNFLSQAYGAALGALLTIVSTAVALWRYHKKGA